MRYIIERLLNNGLTERETIDRQLAAAFIGERALAEIENNRTARDMGAKVLVEDKDADGNYAWVGVDFGAPDEIPVTLTRHEICDLMLACTSLREEADKWNDLRNKLRGALAKNDEGTRN